MYHSISSPGDEAGVSAYYRLATSTSRFRAQMGWLKRSGVDVLPLDEALSRLQSSVVDERPSAVVTFDDGFREFLTAAWPMLNELDFTATVFLPTAFIGTNALRFKGRECLTWKEVRSLHSAGVTFGSHTVHHPKLYELDWSTIRRELADSKSKLEDELQSSVIAFAYPYAFPQEDALFVKHLRYELAAVGYQFAVTTMIGRVARGDDPLSLRRLPVNDCDDDALFAAKISGAYDWLARFQTAQRKLRGTKRADADARDP
jgi:peptidoglycan/xylan/chitin deacetylase (PgdA/CDA1 family)